MAEKTYRVRTNVSDDKVVRIKVDQDVDFLEVLSLKLDQKNNYKLHTSNYGIIIGRVLANDAFGIPNAKVSVFIPLDESDRTNGEITTFYPYTSDSSKNSNNVRYNLLPDYSTDECYRVVGTFPSKRMVLDNKTQIEIFEKYWKYTTITNNAGDYMIYGVPTGAQTVHVDIDLSDIGILSQSPRDFMYKGYDVNQFDSPSQFRESTNLNNLAQIITQTTSVEVYPFWGDDDAGEIAISRCDVQVQYKFEPTCIFFGAVATDDYSSAIGSQCTPSMSSGLNSGLIPSEGTIEMIRKTNDGFVEEFPINANQLIDGDGVWCYQIPMNLDYIGTDEFGNIIKTDNPNKGIPTRTSVRFRFSLQETGNEGVGRHRAKYLVPNNPSLVEGSSEPYIESGMKFNDCYNFGSATPDEYFKDLYWNKIYSVKNYIPRLQKSFRLFSGGGRGTRRYSGIKSVNYNGGKNPAPFNNIRLRIPFLYALVCIICKIIIIIISMINWAIICLIDSICIFGWFPFRIGCLSFGFLFDEDGDDSDVVYVPGCSCGRGKHYANCPEGMTRCRKNWSVGDCMDKMEQTLGEEFQVANLDFYNDWLNGILYFPLWHWRKTKKQSFLFGLFSRAAVNEFCNCKSYYSRLRLAQPCAIGIKNPSKALKKGLVLNASDETRNWHRDFAWIKPKFGYIREILVKNKNNAKLKVYYYAAGTPTLWNYSNLKTPIPYIRLFSTDIILLGSLNDCSFDGLPKLFANLPPTTANIPKIASVTESVSSEDDDEDDVYTGIKGDGSDGNGVSYNEETNLIGRIEMSGMDWTHTGKYEGFFKGVFFDLACTYARTRMKSCVNAQRMCELGVTVDATYTNYSSNRSYMMSDQYEADGLITRHELTDNESRAMFASMNSTNLIPKVEDENTTYTTYKLQYLYPVDFDGKLKRIAPYYTAGHRSHVTYDNFDANYLRFRLGDTIRYYYNATSFMLYENSFYFYFGVNEGSTAIDKFFSKYYSDCYKNDKKPFNYEYTVESARYCPSEERYTEDYGLISVTLSNIKTPYKYTLYDEWDEVVISESDMYDKTIIFGAAGNSEGYLYDDEGNVKRDGRLWYLNPESYSSRTFSETDRFIKTVNSLDEESYVYMVNGTYKLEITDAREKVATQTIIVSPTYISMTASASGLGMKYVGYAESLISGQTLNTSEYNSDLTDMLNGSDGISDSEDYNDGLSDDSSYGDTGEGSTSEDVGDNELLTTPSEATLSKNYSILTSTDTEDKENVNYFVDEKSIICGNDKAGTIIIDSIELDGKSYEVLYISDHKPKASDNLKFYFNEKVVYNGITSYQYVEQKIPEWPKLTEDEYVDGDFFLIVTDDTPESPEGDYVGFVKMSIRPLNHVSFSACSCDYVEGINGERGHYDIGLKLPEGKNNDFYPSYSSPTSGGIYEYGDLDISDNRQIGDIRLKSHINFSVWVPDDYEISLTQYCYKVNERQYELTDNTSTEVLTVENGSLFDLKFNEVPIRFLLGNASAETEYNSDYFNPKATHPSNIPGWFKLHLPSGYRFPSVESGNFELWSNYVSVNESGTTDFDIESKAEIVAYKFNCLFNLSKSCYITNDSLGSLATTSEGGQKPILYIGAYPNYQEEDDLSTYLVDTIGATEVIDEYPNIVGSNYRYKITSRGEGNYWKKCVMNHNKGRIELSLYTGHLYNDLYCKYVGANGPMFNPQFIDHMKNDYVIASNLTSSVTAMGNYFAGFTLNAGLQEITDSEGNCRLSEEYSAKTECYPVCANTFTMCSGAEASYEGNIPQSIREHYFRAETVDRRIDYDMFIYMPSYSSSYINIETTNNQEHISNYGRLYATVYNGIEMAYRGGKGTSKYDIIGKSKKDGLEYYYDIDKAEIYANVNNKLVSKRKRFYSSTLKCGSRKFDITDMYYTGYHLPDNMISLFSLNKKLNETKGKELYSIRLDGNPNSKFYFKNEVNGDFSMENYPTKRTVNIVGIPPSNKLTFSVTSCSYDIECGVNGSTSAVTNGSSAYDSSSGTTTEGTVVQRVTQSTSDDEYDAKNFVVTARTKAGEECSVKIDTRDRVQMYHQFSNNDLETSWNNYEIRYRTRATVFNPYNSSNPVLLARFSRSVDLRLRFRINKDAYCDTHNTYTERPMIINILNSGMRNPRSVYVDGYMNHDNYGGDRNYLDEALKYSVSPKDIVTNIRLNCRAQFTSIESMPKSLKSRNGSIPILDIPIGGKFSDCFMTQTNFYHYPFMVDADNPESEISYDDETDNLSVIYRYGVYTWRSKRHTHYSSDWDDYFHYGRGLYWLRGRYYYHQGVASVAGILYERNYVSTNDDNLGKNIKLIKVGNLFDLRPFYIEFAGSAKEEAPTVLVKKEMYTCEYRWKAWNSKGEAYWPDEWKSYKSESELEDSEDLQKRNAKWESVLVQEPKPKDGSYDSSIQRYGGKGGIRLMVYTPFEYSSKAANHQWFTLFNWKSDTNSAYGYKIDDCNVEDIKLCIDSNPNFIGSTVNFKYAVWKPAILGYKEVPALEINIAWPGQVMLDSEIPLDDADTNLAETINDFFHRNGGRGMGLVLKMKNGFSYTVLFVLGYYHRKSTWKKYFNAWY